MKPDLQDVFVFGGLALLTAGVAMLSVPWALICCGALCMALPLAGRLRR